MPEIAAVVLKVITSEAFVGVFVGGAVTFFIELLIKRREEKHELSHCASLLLNDLKSIIKYIENAKTLIYPTVNIRYSYDWQSMVSKCVFLNDKEVSLLYDIYDLVYDTTTNMSAK